jgi:hypothetical protein
LEGFPGDVSRVWDGGGRKPGAFLIEIIPNLRVLEFARGFNRLDWAMGIGGLYIIGLEEYSIINEDSSSSTVLQYICNGAVC